MALGYKNHMHIAMPSPFFVIATCITFDYSQSYAGRIAILGVPICMHVNTVSEVAPGFLVPPLLLAALAIEPPKSSSL